MKFKNLYEELFYQALRIRLAEEKIIEIYPTDKIQSPVHLSIGQEAVAVGACYDLNREDMLFCNYRSHAFYLAKGGEMKKMFAELYGKVTGDGKGKAGSMHLFSKSAGMTVSSAVVASTIAPAVGAAFGMKQRKLKSISVSVFGDGATEEGVIHEALNFASLHKVPVLFICENNGLAIHSKLNVRHSYDILGLPKLYKIPSVECHDGHDPLKVFEIVSPLVRKIRQGDGPQFIEIHTSRYKEHVGPADDFHFGYRSDEETNQWKLKDPLILDTRLIEKFRPQILDEIKEAVAFAEKSDWPGREQLLADVL